MTDKEYNEIKQEIKYLVTDGSCDKVVNIYLLKDSRREEYEIRTAFTKKKLRLICRKDKGSRRRGLQNKLSFSILTDDNKTLCRIDTAGRNHTNPDKREVEAPHMHIYKEGYDDSFAYPLSEIDNFEKCDSEASILFELLNYFSVVNIGSVEFNANLL